MSLRACDGEFYKSALAKYYLQGEYSVNIRSTTQANYRKRRAARLRTERLVQARTGQRPPQYYNIRDKIRASIHITHFPSTSLTLFNLIGQIFSYHSRPYGSLEEAKLAIEEHARKPIRLKWVSNVEGK
uniref:AlNc14C47G3810 protein n=1 Tax=Albugo laibachii Nc14 TaxID=890382 RepID=F0WAU8_9STRA|nr:AlNc14C47G3810 [Albugo laibachii Nc14]|eukprot:CCA18270.1 AlNc14C47G3810 [Albugo laibachii Nc14]